MSEEKLRKFSYLTVIALGAAVVLYFFFRYLFLLLLPFGIAWLVAALMRPVAAFLHRKTRLPEKLLRVLISVLLLLTVLGGLGALAVRLVTEGIRLLSDAASTELLTDVFSFFLHPFSGWFGSNAASADLEQGAADALGGVLSSLLSSLVTFLSRVAAGVPRIILFTFVTLIATAWFAVDLEKVSHGVLTLLPEGARDRLLSWKRGALVTAGKYIGSYLVIMAITFAVMTFGFLILGVRYALLVALIVALLDALPVIGVGTVLIPWSLYELLLGKHVPLAVGLAVLYLGNELLRQFIEPRLIGKNLGVHPLVSLTFLYVGYALFGVLGLLFVPIALGSVAILARR